MANLNLHSAKRAKNDEFYTQMSDIESELAHYWNVDQGSRYRNPFKGKTVLLNCDDPTWSNFWKYFAQQFDHLEIGRLISTHYEMDGSPSYAQILERDVSGAIITDGYDGYVPRGRRVPLQGNGDFRSPECVEFLKQSDIVVTNPPFSLFREFVAQLMEHEKQFLLIGNQNAITYKEIFPLLRDNKMWLGTHNGDLSFTVPADSEPRATRFWIDSEGVKWRSLGNACWFTNLDHQKRHENINLFCEYDGHEFEYPTYDNYDAINVDRVNKIPMDYFGKMGVPITFLGNYNPDQFEILGIDRYIEDNPVPNKRFTISGKEVYARILIRNKHPKKPFRPQFNVAP